MFFTNNQFYSIYELAKLPFFPINQAAQSALAFLNNDQMIGHNQNFKKNYEAIFTLIERLTRAYHNPYCNIKNIEVNGESLAVDHKIILTKPFCELVHFKTTRENMPKILVVAPLAGHHASIVLKTVINLLPSFDVYLTSWVNASTVPLSQGKFDLHDCVQYLIDFLVHIGERITVMAVCQPGPEVLAATSLLAQAKSDYVPKCLVLAAAPIDTRENPTLVNKFATSHDLKWFEDNMITQVPINYPGCFRKVYPGFLQLMGFVNLNIYTHFESHLKLFHAIIEDDVRTANKVKQFYDNYFSVSDLTAEFYLQTVDEVFQKCSIAKGKMIINDKLVDLSLIKDTAILCIEGDRDNITGIGQTKAALKLCTNLADHKKAYHLQPGVGHYGVFTGKKFKNLIMPVIKEFVYKHLDVKSKVPNKVIKIAQPKKDQPSSTILTNKVVKKSSNTNPKSKTTNKINAIKKAKQ